MDTLKDLLLVDGVRRRVILDCVDVLEGEVRKKSGVSGLLIKGGFKVVRKLEGGRMIENAVDMLLDEFVEAIEPFYASYNEDEDESKPPFGRYLANQDEDVAEALLGVTDRRRQRAKNKVLIKTYDKLRSVAKQNVKEGVPAVGQLMQKYAFDQKP